MRFPIRPAVLLVVVVLAGSCSSSAKPTARVRAATSTTAVTATTTAPRDEAIYASPGPYKVGYTTLRMTDRYVDVWYPADQNTVEGKAKATYTQRTPLPPDLKHFVPDAYNTVVTMEAYKDVAGSAKGPFPVVLFSHGASAYRMANSALTAGIASWGFVVVSADYLERGVVTQLPGQKPLTLDPKRDKRLMLASLDLITKENERAASVLHGIIDGTRVAAAGHSAGGTTAFDALNDPRVKGAVGWAPSAPSATPADKPTMIIGASNDIGVPPTQLATTYGSFPAPKRRVEIGNAGHNSFTDLCLVTRSGGGMVQYAVKSHLVGQALAKLLLNGCEKTAVIPEQFFPVVQHFTVAELRSVLHIDTEEVGLGDTISRAFPGITITYRHQP
jgi:dienelactone hydrolase